MAWRSHHPSSDQPGALANSGKHSGGAIDGIIAPFLEGQLVSRKGFQCSGNGARCKHFRRIQEASTETSFRQVVGLGGPSQVLNQPEDSDFVSNNSSAFMVLTPRDQWCSERSGTGRATGCPG